MAGRGLFLSKSANDKLIYVTHDPRQLLGLECQSNPSIVVSLEFDLYK